MSNWFMKEPCEHCPFRRDVKPFLRPERGEQLAYHTTNKYNDFPCHKTTVPDERDDDYGGTMLRVDKSKECAGFLTMQINGGKDCPDGFTPAFELVYDHPSEMAYAYNEQNETR